MRSRIVLHSILAAALGVGATCLAQQPAPPPPQVHSLAAAKRQQIRKNAEQKPSPAQPAAAAATPEPPPPDWPANNQPKQATVVWNSQGLRIEAANSSLQQILHEVSTDTGAKVEGLHTDQRIFGSFGPGPARDVLSQLLDGTGLNVLMIGDQGQGTPREIMLSEPPKGPAPPPRPNQNNDAEENDYAEQPQPQPPPPAQPQPAPNVTNGFNPGAPRTPQQIIQELQQRQQQIQQMQQQQQQQQQQNSPP